MNGKSEAILVDTQGLPLYYHRGDTAKKSFVSGELVPTLAGAGVGKSDEHRNPWKADRP